MDNRFKRHEMLIKETGQAALSAASVIVFGVGGVGSSAVESLARSGIGHFTLVDSDVVDVTNINRQLLAVTDTVGKPKTGVQAERIYAINPDAEVVEKPMFYLPENAHEIDLSKYDYIIDAIDTVSAKLELIVRAKQAGVPIISCMGTGNKLHPEQLTVADIYKTKVCPLCRVMRRELKKRGVENLKVVYSEEIPVEVGGAQTEEGRTIPGSMPFVPPAAGFLIASQVVLDLLSNIGGEQ